MSTFWRIALGCQLPVRSGCPSAVRGVGPEGGQLGSPPRPCADTALEVSKAAATAATARVKCLTTRCMQAGYHRTARITSHRRCLLENSIAFRTIPSTVGCCRRPVADQAGPCAPHEIEEAFNRLEEFLERTETAIGTHRISLPTPLAAGFE